MVWGLRVVYIFEKIFILASVALIVYAVIYFQKPMQSSIGLMSPQQSSFPSTDSKENISVVDDNLVALVAKRDLFNAVLMPKDLNAALPTQLPNSLPVNFKVVGVILGNPSQIVIEDSNTHQTHFITKGNQSEGIDLLDVNRSQAVIQYQGQEITLPIEAN